jgi:2-methylcitrate dehydratase PrpD
MLSIAAGYEIGIRVAMAAGPSHYQYWHTTGTCGTFGAAAGAARLLNLDKDRIAEALGSAGTQASGLWEFLVENAMSKQLHPGKASFNGLLSALLAHKGFTGAHRILEGEKGFLTATSEIFDTEKCIEDLGKKFHFERNSLKYHASCGHTHAAIDAVLSATGGNPFDPETIRYIKVRIYQAALDLLGDVKPVSPYLAKFNLPFCIAGAVKFGHAGPSTFTDEQLRDPDIRHLMECIEISSDPELSRMYPRKWPARV